jgi:hypothetical protein
MCLASLVVSILPRTTAAEDEPFTGIDLTVLIDHSGSMWGIPIHHPAKNDKWNHRISETQIILERFAEHAEETGLTHRVSVVGFGDSAFIQISNLEMRADPSDPGALVRRVRTIAARDVEARYLGNTNTPEAIELATAEYSKMAASEPRAGRRRLMLIITDGRANLPPASKAQMKERVRTEAAAAKAQNVEMWVVGLNDADNYWYEGDGAFWEDVTGGDRARLAETASTGLTTVFQAIVDSWLGIRSVIIPPEDNSYECPPYLRKIIFKVTFGKSLGAFEILDPAGTPVARMGGAIGKTPVARYVVLDPEAGSYALRRDPKQSCVVQVEEYSARVDRLAPAMEIDVGAETRIVFSATMADGEPMELLPAYPLDASIVVEAPTGAVENLPAPHAGSGKFAAAWRPPEPGTYHASIEGIIRRSDGTDYDVFAANARSYDDRIEVTSREPYYLEMVRPVPSKTAGILPWQHRTAVHLRLLDPEHSEVTDPTSVVTTTDGWLSLEVIDEHGRTLDGPLSLAHLEEGIFASDVPIKVDWKKGQGWWIPARINLRVLSAGGMMEGDRYLNAILLPAEAEELRIGADPMTVGPIGIRYQWYIIATIIVLIAAAIAAVGWLLLSRYMPYYLIKREDAARPSVDLKVYDLIDDPSGFRAQKMSVKGNRFFKYDGQLRLSLPDGEVVATRLRIERLPSPGKPQAMIEYSWGDETKRHGTLVSSGRPCKLEGLPESNMVIILSEE